MKQVFNESFPPATAATRGRRIVAREVRSNMVASALATLMLSCCCILLVEVCMHLVDCSIRTNIFRIVIKYFPGHYWHRRAHPQLQQRPLHRQGGGAEGELWLVEAGHVTSILTSDWSRRRRLTTSVTWRGPRWRFHFRRWRGGCLSTFWDTRWQNTQHEIFHPNKTIARSPTWSTCSDARAGAETPSTLWPASRSGTETRDSCNHVLISTDFYRYLHINNLIFNIYQIFPFTSSPPAHRTAKCSLCCATKLFASGNFANKVHWSFIIV